MVPLCDVGWQYEQLQESIDAAVRDVLSTGRYVLGPNVAALESEISDYLQCGYAVGVNSGTDALQLALRALGIGPGDEVITTPFTFIATSEAIGLVGGTPVFADIDPQTFNLDPQQVEAAVTPRTKALLPVHLYGHPCDMDAILAVARRHSLYVVEDCAQALGARIRGKRVGAFGDVSCLSFFPSKNLGGVGDGGMVVTDSPEIYERVEMLRRHGGRVKYHHSELGLNSRLDELQAAVLRIKLARLDEWNARRRAVADRYDQALASVHGIRVPPNSKDGEGSEPVYHQYTIQLDERDSLKQSLTESGVQSFAYYPIPLHLQPVHADLGYKPGDFPNAERLASQCLSLPMHPGITDRDQSFVTREITRSMARVSGSLAA